MSRNQLSSIFRYILNIFLYFYSIQLHTTWMSIAQSGITSRIKGSPVAYNLVDQIPVQQSRRPCTDILCTIIGVLLFLGLGITALVIYNDPIYIKTNFPTDSDGKLCGVDWPAYRYLYFANAPNIDRRVCVTKCPAPTDAKLDCVMTKTVGCKYSTNPAYEVKQYEVQVLDGYRAGFYCLPKDDVLRDQLEQNAKIDTRLKFMNSLDTIVLSMIISAGISLIFLILVQLFPKFMNWAVIFAAMVLTLALAICMFTYYSNGSQTLGKILAGVVLLVVCLICILNFFKNRQAIRLNGIFLQWATKALRDNLLALIYIPIFMALLTLFFILIIYQFKSFWTGGGEVYFDASESIFWEFKSTWSVVLTVLLAIEALWGLSFFKQAFNFVISGVVVGWYFKKPDWGCCKPSKYLVFNHLGSVIASAFMIAFFSLFDYLFDLVTPRRQYGKVSGSTQDTDCYSKAFNTCCSPCLKLFNLVRPDSLAYINIAGNPYCNAARYCHYMSMNSIVLASSQETSNTYRLAAHFTIASIVGILCIYVKGNIVPTSLFVILFLSIFISSYFISFHADAASAIGVSFVSNEEYIKRSGQYFDTGDRIPEDMYVRNQLARDINLELEQDPNKIC